MRRALASAVAAAAAVVGVVVTLRHLSHPRPEPFAAAAALPPGAVARIGSDIFARVGGFNTELLALSPDGRTLWAGDDDGVVRAWDVDRAAPLWSLVPHPDFVPGDATTIRQQVSAIESSLRGYREPAADLEASPDGRRIATCSGAMIRVFDAATGAYAAEHRTGTRLQQVEWTSDGRSVAWCEDGRVAAWDVEDDTVRRSETLSKEWCFLGVRPDGALVAAGTDTGGLVVLDPRTLDRAGPDVVAPDGWEALPVFDRRSRALARRWARGEPTRFAWIDGPDAPPEPFYESESWAMLVAMPVRGRSLVVTSPAGIDLVRTDDATRRLVARGTVRGASFSADGRRCALAALGRARVFDAEAGRFLRSDDEAVSTEVFVPLPDGRRLLVAACDGRVLECDVETGAVLRRFDVGIHDVLSIVVSSDGTVAAGVAGRLFRIDLASGAVESFTGGALEIGLREGRVLRVGGVDGAWSVVDGATGAGVPLEGMDGVTSVQDLRFSADAEAVQAEVGGHVRRWSTRTGARLDADDAGVRFAPRAGQQSRDGRVVEIHDPQFGRTLARLAEPVPYDGDVAAVDDERAALGRASGEIHVLSRADGVVVQRLAAPAAVRALAFVPGGRRLVSGLADGTIVIWGLAAVPPAR